MGVKEIDLMLKILALVLFSPSDYDNSDFFVSFIEAFLFLEAGDVQLLVQNIASLVSLQQPLHRRVPYLRILHASLKDYLVDPTRSKDLYINPLSMHSYFAQISLAHLNTGELLLLLIHSNHPF